MLENWRPVLEKCRALFGKNGGPISEHWQRMPETWLGPMRHWRSVSENWRLGKMVGLCWEPGAPALENW